jgi:hypothetical protein
MQNSFQLKKKLQSAHKNETFEQFSEWTVIATHKTDPKLDFSKINLENFLILIEVCYLSNI